MKSKQQTFVYFIQAGVTGPIKIGVTDDLWERLATLQTANHQPLKLVACFVGTHIDEINLHRQFHESRLLGEWFKCTDGLLALVDQHRSNVPKQPVGPRGVGVLRNCNACGWEGRQELATFGFDRPSCPSCHATYRQMLTPRQETT